MWNAIWCRFSCHSSWAQCDQIRRFIGLWATFQSLWQQLICPILLHSYEFFCKGVEIFIFFQWNHFWATFIDILLVTLVLGKTFVQMSLSFFAGDVTGKIGKRQPVTKTDSHEWKSGWQSWWAQSARTMWPMLWRYQSRLWCSGHERLPERYKI